MTDPRFDDRRDVYGPMDPEDRWTWMPGAMFVLCLLGAIGLWAYLSGEKLNTASRVDPDATTGQSTRPAVKPVPQRPAPNM